jgi:hypothetical protein
MKATVHFVFTSVNFTDCSAVGRDAGDAEERSGARGFVLVTGAAAGGPGPAGRWVAGLLLDRGVPVRAMARTQDHRAQQLRQLGAEVIAEDLRKIADVESCGEAAPQTADRPSRRQNCTSPPLTGLKIEHVRCGVIAAPGVARPRGQAWRLWLAETG